MQLNILINSEVEINAKTQQLVQQEDIDEVVEYLKAFKESIAHENDQKIGSPQVAAETFRKLCRMSLLFRPVVKQLSNLVQSQPQNFGINDIIQVIQGCVSLAHLIKAKEEEHLRNKIITPLLDQVELNLDQLSLQEAELLCYSLRQLDVTRESFCKYLVDKSIKDFKKLSPVEISKILYSVASWKHLLVYEKVNSLIGVVCSQSVSMDIRSHNLYYEFVTQQNIAVPTYFMDQTLKNERNFINHSCQLKDIVHYSYLKTKLPLPRILYAKQHEAIWQFMKSPQSRDLLEKQNLEFISILWNLSSIGLRFREIEDEFKGIRIQEKWNIVIKDPTLHYKMQKFQLLQDLYKDYLGLDLSQQFDIS